MSTGSATRPREGLRSTREARRREERGPLLSSTVDDDRDDQSPSPSPDEPSSSPSPRPDIDIDIDRGTDDPDDRTGSDRPATPRTGDDQSSSDK